MGNASFNQDWYGMQAKVLAQSDDRVVVDYGCKGRGIVKNYNLFEGIQLCFLDFESDESMETQKFWFFPISMETRRMPISKNTK